MRINAQYHQKEAKGIEIRSNGQPVRFCSWFDTELGIAECTMYRERVNEYGQVLRFPLYAYDYDLEEARAVTYYLHTFEIYNERGELLEMVH